MSLVGTAKNNGFEIDSIKDAIKKSINLIDYTFSKKVNNVVIKPNMCYYWDYTTGHTTDPSFVAALIDLIRDEISPGVNISIIESDASAMKCRYAFKILGYEKIAQDYNVNLINLSQEKTVELSPVSINGKTFNFKLPEIIQKADLRINIPKPKYMDPTTITCALKNIFGCNPEPLKYKLHSSLAESIVGLNLVMPFNLHILDGLIVAGALPRKLNLVMASQDPVALDSAVARLMSENPKKIKHLKLAQKMDLGKTTFVNKGEDIEHFRNLFPRKSKVNKLLLAGYTAALRVGLLKTV